LVGVRGSPPGVVREAGIRRSSCKRRVDDRRFYGEEGAPTEERADRHRSGRDLGGAWVAADPARQGGRVKQGGERDYAMAGGIVRHPGQTPCALRHGGDASMSSERRQVREESDMRCIRNNKGSGNCSQGKPLLANLGKPRTRGGAIGARTHQTAHRYSAGINPFAETSDHQLADGRQFRGSRTPPMVLRRRHRYVRGSLQIARRPARQSPSIQNTSRTRRLATIMV